MQQPPNPKNLTLFKTPELQRHMDDVKRAVDEGVYIDPAKLRATAERLMEVLADDTVPHRP